MVDRIKKPFIVSPVKNSQDPSYTQFHNEYGNKYRGHIEQEILMNYVAVPVGKIRCQFGKKLFFDNFYSKKTVEGDEHEVNYNKAYHENINQKQYSVT
jgi:hypothetical protein